MKELYEAWQRVDRNKVAALLSVVPGLGHLYKHHYVAGLGLMVAGNVLVLFAAFWLAFATLGLSFLLLPLWVAGVACAAHEAEDRHGAHPWLHGREWLARAHVIRGPAAGPRRR